jgi:hypothetical protein
MTAMSLLLGSIIYEIEKNFNTMFSKPLMVTYQIDTSHFSNIKVDYNDNMFNMHDNCKNELNCGKVVDIIFKNYLFDENKLKTSKCFITNINSMTFTPEIQCYEFSILYYKSHAYNPNTIAH